MIENLINTAKIIAGISFILGTMILVIFLNLKQGEDIIVIGYVYTLITLLVNLIVFIILLGYAINNKPYRTKLLKTCGLLLLNIPIAISYLMIVINTVISPNW